MSMGPESNTGVENTGVEVDQPQDVDLHDPPPRELESALLSLALFGGLVLFGVGCMVFGWN